MGSDYIIFVPMVKKVLNQYNLNYFDPQYDELVELVIKRLPIPDKVSKRILKYSLNFNNKYLLQNNNNLNSSSAITPSHSSLTGIRQ